MLDLKDVIEYALQIADAIQAAHAKDITHRDIKSDNVMVTADGRIKVMDFGLAKLKGALQLTKSTSTVGTLAYMAPEQLQGKDTDSRMDIFSFGVVLYEMLTGKLPFQAEYEAALMYSVVNTEPESATKYRPDLSSEMLHLLNRALEKDPDDRYQTMQEVLIDLRRSKRDTSKVIPRPPAEMLASKETGTSTERRSMSERKRFSLYIGIISVIVFFIAVGIWFWFSESKPKAPHLVNPVQVTTAIGIEDYPALSPDGRMIAYQSDQSGNLDIWIRQIDGGSTVNLTEDYAGSDRCPSWSPDGNLIAFWSEREGGGCYIIPALGGAVRKVSSLPRIASIQPPQWSPDCNELAYQNSDWAWKFFIEIVSLQRGTTRTIPLPGPKYDPKGFELNWSPDGKYFTYGTAWGYSSALSSLWLVRSSDGQGMPVTQEGAFDRNPNWSTDGRTILFLTNRGGSLDLWHQQITMDGKPDGSPQLTTAGLGIRYASLARDGKKIAYSSGRRVSNLWRIAILSGNN